MNAGDCIQIAVAGVLTATLVVVLWYAWETRKQAVASVQMAGAMREQTLAADRPFLLIEVRRLESTEFLESSSDSQAGPDPYAGYPKGLVYRVFNAGRGPAKEIGTSIRHPGASYNRSSKDVLRPGDTWDVGIELKNEWVALFDDSLAESPPKGLNDFLVTAGAPALEPGYDCGIVVTYTDIHDRTYLAYLRFGMIAVTDRVRKVVTNRTIKPVEQKIVALPP